MNIDSLKLFCLVVEEGAFSKAARLSYISQPAVTRHIHLLEDYYGTLLFDREDGKLTLLEAGKVLYSYAKIILEDVDSSKEAIHELVGTYDILVRLGGTLSIGDYLLPGLIADFKKLHPDVRINLDVGNTPSMVEKLQKDEIDVALIEGLVDEKDLQVENFAEDELVLVCHPKHRWADKGFVSLKELPEECMIYREAASGTHSIIRNALEGKEIFQQIEHYMEFGSVQAAKSAVEAGLGVSILSKITVAKELRYGMLKKVEIKDLQMKRDLWLVRKQKRFQRKSVDLFLDFIRNKNWSEFE
ncbi:LysR family transcriptional regulator [Oceanobacillus sp. Castelsardo]|uniref:LysR family transcriptional regulator n=1 Tax=Oceanobacillus sp. Castelsardo TaxID=1851204 RepID=UPI0008385F89|nr:LysR family transcriptional regulator [Oceanobacillus sp. Castelsardo]